ncbi:MAG: TIGR03943 family protein [Anaerolineae bacterium]|nr:TIGR03943 family protein [Anaerolineae bacterium]
MRTRRWFQAALMLLLGLYLLETLLTGEIAYYINERFNWLAGLAGFILIALGTVNVIVLLSEPEQNKVTPHSAPNLLQDVPSAAHSMTARWYVLVILSVPLLFGIFLPAQPLGAAAINNSGVTFALNVSGAGEQAFSIAPTQRNVLDWVRAFSASNNVDEFSGLPADLVGFVYRDARFDETTEFMVTRFTVSCCVADAVAIGVIVRSEQASNFSADSWVRVQGKFEVRDFQGQRMPILIAESIEQVAMPERPYLFP